MNTAKVFWSGRSQAVRLPKAFRLNSDTVRIKRHGEAIILEPIAKDWSWLNNLSETFDNDFIKATEEQPIQQDRNELEKLFK